ncbi:hypothetical protein CDCA_CDCA09G2666 [Cyanidium caldarium]|uniref:Pre-mRNA polyadenylation factor Fip1 domain-containing protein n=1 Tax=Cyanidium caldarium TaxID=2771 RepID=A0AAV9IWZ7_CYACA|nr:hypothetical protein CDCA_CDCA09G2666 [Cyanidium caldarium]
MAATEDTAAKKAREAQARESDDEGDALYEGLEEVTRPSSSKREVGADAPGARADDDESAGGTQSVRVAAAAPESSEDEEEEEEESSEEDVDVVLGGAQSEPLSVQQQTARFAQSWNQLTRDDAAAAAGAVEGVGAGGAAALTSATLDSMLPQPTVPDLGPSKQKSLYEVELEQLGEKPWREPGADLADYFNYGFTEDTWKMYCQRQVAMRQETQALGRQVPASSGAVGGRERDRPPRPTRPTGPAARDPRERRGENESGSARRAEASMHAPPPPPPPPPIPSRDVFERLAQARTRVMEGGGGARGPAPAGDPGPPHRKREPLPERGRDRKRARGGGGVPHRGRSTQREY